MATNSASPRTQDSSVVVLCLSWLGLLWVLVGLALAIYLLHQDVVAYKVTAQTAVNSVLAIMLGLTGGAICWGMAWLCRLGAQREPSALTGAGGGAPVGTALPPLTPTHAASAQALPPRTQPVPVLSPSALDALLEQLRELNCNVLLSESQRQVKREFLQRRELPVLRQRFAAQCAALEVRAAGQTFDNIARIAPDLADLETLRSQLELTQGQARSKHVNETRRWVEDFLAAHDFQAAAAAAAHLESDYPGLSEAGQLTQYVQRRHEEYIRQQRQGMLAVVEKHAAAKQWQAAVDAGQDLIDLYPDSPEGHLAAQKMPTLRDNARLQEARDLRDRITHMLSERQFSAALELARQVMARFPETAAAEELRQQMARLEELAKGEQPA
jgi:hypothetical protein